MSNVNLKINTFFSQFPQTHFIKGELIIQPEKTVSSLYFIEKGIVRMYLLSRDGSELIHHIFRKGAFIPLLSVITETPNRYYYEALSDIDLRLAPKEKALDFIQKNGDVCFELTKRVFKGLDGMLYKIEFMVFDNSYKKLVNLLIYLAKIFGQKDIDGTLINLPLTQNTIASYIGLNRETVTRQIHKLKEKKYLKYRGDYLVISDIDSLQKETV